MEWRIAPDIKREIERIIAKLNFSHLLPDRIFCFRSFGSSSRAQARIWSLPRIWQQALKAAPAYCLEIISEKFDKIKPEQKKKILIHELLHIPQNFSGSLLAHRSSRGLSFGKRVEILFKEISQGRQ